MTDKLSISKEILPEPLRWLHILPRWSLISAIGAMILSIVFLGGLGQHVSDLALGTEFVEMLQAVRNPNMFRAVWTIDAIIWLLIGGSLIVIGGVLRYHTPIRASFIAICGITQILGAFGSFLRLDGISDIASRYMLALPEQQIALLNSYQDLGRVINSTNHIAVLFQGLGFLFVSWGALSLSGFPRWLAFWFALPGFLAIAQFGIFITGAAYLFLLNVLGLIAGNIALNFAISITLWRPSDLLISSLWASTQEIKQDIKTKQADL